MRLRWTTMASFHINLWWMCSCVCVFRHTCSYGCVHMEPEVNMVFETVTLSGTCWLGQGDRAASLRAPPASIPLHWDYQCIPPCCHIWLFYTDGFLAPHPWVTCTTHRAILSALVLESVAGRLICRHGSASGSDHRCLWSPHFLCSLGAVYISSNRLRDVSTLKLPLVH